MELNFEKLLMQVPITKIYHIEDNEIYSLLEKFNICWSIKIKTMYWILKKAIERWDLKKWKTLLEASSWNAAISLAYLANALWFDAEIVVPIQTASCKKKLIKSYWAKLVEVAGDTDDSIKVKNELFEKDKEKYFMTQQFDNLDNFEAHYNLTWPYIAEKLWKIDFIVAGLWTCGSLLWTWAYLKEKFPEVKIIAINPIQRVEWIYNYEEKMEDGQIYMKYKYLIDETIEVDFDNDVISWVNDYLSEWYFNWISSGAILSWAKKYLKWKKWLKWILNSTRLMRLLFCWDF